MMEKIGAATRMYATRKRVIRKMLRQCFSMLLAFIIIVGSVPVYLMEGMAPAYASADPVPNWILTSSPTAAHLNDVAHGHDGYVAVGSGGQVVHSTLGDSWTMVQPVASELYGVAYGSGKYIAVMSNGRIIVSDDGVSWTSQVISANHLNSIAYDNGIFMVVGENGTVLTSSDGESWVNRSLSDALFLSGVDYVNGAFYAQGFFTTLKSSDNGATWTSANLDYSKQIAYGNGKYVAIDLFGAIRTSTDGLSWSDGIAYTEALKYIAFAGDRFIAGGDSGLIVTSDDGMSWTPQEAIVANSLKGLVYHNGSYVIVGDNGTIVRSAPPSIVYHGNGHTGGSVPGGSYNYNASITLPDGGDLHKTGYSLTGWNTAANGGGTHYDLGGSFTTGEETTVLYAEWTANRYDVIYDGNNSTGGAVPDVSEHEYGASVAVPGNPGHLARTGYTFSGWSTSADGSGTIYTEADMFTMGAADVTLYAYWEPIRYTVTFDGNTNTGGSVPTAEYDYNSPVTVPGSGSLVKEGYIFTGWNRQADGSGTRYVEGETFPMDADHITLFAQWSLDRWEQVTNDEFSIWEEHIQTFIHKGIPYVAYSDASQLGSITVERYADHNWETLGDAGFSPIYRVDFSMFVHDDIPYVAFPDSAVNVNIHVMKFVDDNWVSVGTPGLSEYAARIPSVYVYEGTPYVAYAESRFGESFVVVEKYTGDGWEKVGDTDFTRGQIGELSLYIDNGTPYVAFTDQFLGGKLSVIQYANGSWEALGGLRFTPGSSRHLSLHVDNGIPYVAYQDGSSANRATVAKYTGNGWETVGAAGFSAGSIASTSLYVNNGTPYVSYRDESSASRAIVKLFNGTHWETLGNSLLSEHEASDTSIFVDDGMPYVAFQDRDSDGSNRTVIKRFAVNRTVTYSGNGNTSGSAPLSSNHYHKSLVSAEANVGHLQKDNHTFTGWNTAPDGSGTHYDVGETFVFGAADLTLYADWEFLRYTVRFNSNGGSDVNDQTVSHGSAAVQPEDPTRTGYTFEGWYADSSFMTPFSFSTPITDHTTLYAKWTLNEYNVTFDKNGGDADANPAVATAVYGGNVGSLPTPPTRAGFTFTGWNTAPGGDGGPFDAATAVVADITVYAQWTEAAPPTYTVTFDKNGGEADANPAVLTAVHGGNVGSLPIPPTRAGFTFTGWNTAPGGDGNSFHAATAVVADITVYAQWTEAAPPTYTVTFDKNGGEADANPAVLTAVHGGNVGSLPIPPTRAGFTFTGWNTAPGGTGDPFDAATAVIADITVYAQWTEAAPLTHTVTFHKNGGEADANPTVVTAVYGGNVGSLPTPPIRAGYTFAGWNTAPGGDGNPFHAATAVVADITVYAQWTEETPSPAYTVTFDKNGGEADANPTVLTVVYGGNVGSLPTPPIRAGYTFAGWNTAPGGDGNPFHAATAVVADITVYAQWTETASPTYTVTYNGNGHTGGSVPIDHHPYVQGAAVTVQGNTGGLTRTGYRFAGWNTEVDGSGTRYAAESAFTMGTEDVTLYAQWTADNGGSSGGGGGSPVPAPSPSPSRDAESLPTDGKWVLPAHLAGEVSLGEGVTVIIPAGASDKQLILTIEQVPDPQQLLTERDRLASPVYEVLKNFAENFEKPVTLIFAFDRSNLNTNQVPVVRYYDEAKKEWVEIAGGKIEGNRIAVEVNHFTKFAVFAADEAATAPAQEPAKLAISFGDITGHWAENRIKQAVSDGLITGYPDGTFKPNHSVTRAEFTVMLAGALKWDGTGVALPFTDQDQIGAWATRAVALAVQAGIVSGYEDGSFRPDAKITRAEMASMIAKALKLSLDEDAQSGFADDEEIPKWAKGGVEGIRKRGIISGRGGNKFVPNDTATRSEAVVMLLGMLERNRGE